MSQLNNANFKKFTLKNDKTMINEMKSIFFPQLPRHYKKIDLLQAYLFALKNYYERFNLMRENSKKITINLYDRDYKRFITKVINIFYAISIVKRQEKLNKEL